MSPQPDDVDECMNLADQVIALRGQLRRLGWNSHSPQADDVRRQMIALSLQLDDLGCPPVPIRNTPPPPPPSAPKKGIVGIEVTQAIQFFRFNGQGSGVGRDNSVPLVAGKDLICRVYADVTPGFTLTGEAVYERLRPYDTTIYPINNEPGQALGPGYITSRDASSIDRGNPNHTLNFRIPAVDCNGKEFRIDFAIYLAQARGSPEQYIKDWIIVEFKNVPNPRIHAVLVNYTGNGGANLPVPTILDFLNAFAYVRKVYPLSNFNFSGFEVIQFNGDLTAPVPPGGCGNWQNLLDTLAAMRTASNSTEVYVAIVPFSPGIANQLGGCGGGGPKAASIVGNNAGFAQETGHAYGRKHAPCGGALAVDPNYPIYGSYPSGSIGEYGFDGSTSTTFDPNSSADFMSYCNSNPWVSPYTYMALMNVFTPNMMGRTNRPETELLTGHLLYLNFRLHRESVELLSAFHLPDLVADRNGTLRSAISCELQDATGKMLVFHRCGIGNPHECPSGPFTTHNEIMLWHPDASRIAFFRDSKSIGTLTIEDGSPQVPRPTIVRTDVHHLISLEWASSPSEKTVSHESLEKPSPSRKASSSVIQKANTYLVRYSHDGGATWQALVANLTEPRLAIDLNLLPGGDACVFQVVGSSGIRTSVNQTEPIVVPRKLIKVRLLHPSSGSEFMLGEAVRFQGVGYSPDHGIVPLDDILWISNLDGLIGTGYEIFVPNLSPGRHRITLSCPDGRSGETTEDVLVTIRR